MSPILSLPSLRAGVGASAPFTGIDATLSRIEAFWDGAPDQIDGTKWLSKYQHPNLANADVTMINGTVYNDTVTTGDGSIGYWAFNGTSQYGWINDLNYGTLGSHGNSNNGRMGEITFIVWFRTSYGTPNAGAAWDNSNWSWLDWDRSECLSYNIGAGGKIQFSGESNTNVGAYYDITGDTPCNDGNWHMASVVISSSNSYIKFYLDGEPDGTRTYSFSTMCEGARRWGFMGDGSEAAGNNGARNNIYYEGDIAQMALLSEFWSDAQIKNHFTKTRSRFGV